MRNTRLLFLTTLALFALAATAWAQSTAQYTITGSATSGGTKKKPKPSPLGFGFSVTDPSGNQTPPLQTYKIAYEGGRINTGLLPACTAAKINAAGNADGCPGKSEVGSGSLTALVGTAGQPTSGAAKCDVDLTIFAGGTGHLTLYVKTGPPKCVAPISEAIDMKYSQDAQGAGVTFTVPEELRHQLGLDITVVDTKVTFKKITVKKGKKKVGYIESTGCADKSRTMTVTFTDETGTSFPLTKDIGKC